MVFRPPKGITGGPNQAFVPPPPHNFLPPRKIPAKPPGTRRPGLPWDFERDGPHGVQTAFSPSKAEKGRAGVSVVAVITRSKGAIAASMSWVRQACAIRGR